MKIINAVKTGLARSVRAWKGIVIVWFVTLITVSLLALPMKGALKAGLGDSMITEKLAKGINIEVFADLGANFSSMSSYFLSGLLMIFIVAFVTNSFLTGGLFNSLKELSGAFSSRKFFIASAKYFWSFIIISLVLDLVILLLGFLIIGIPVSIVAGNEASSEGVLLKTFIFAASVFSMIVFWLLVVADYARAWQVSKKKTACFKALGFGFSQTYKTFLLSYPLMLILIFVQMLYGILVLYVLSGIKPVTGIGIILLFMLSQVFFFIKALLKAWRYGSVIRMMEINS